MPASKPHPPIQRDPADTLKDLRGFAWNDERALFAKTRRHAWIAASKHTSSAQIAEDLRRCQQAETLSRESESRHARSMHSATFICSAILRAAAPGWRELVESAAVEEIENRLENSPLHILIREVVLTPIDEVSPPLRSQFEAELNRLHRARSALIFSIIRLSLHLGSREFSSHSPAIYAIQAFEAVQTAVDRFSPDRGARLSTYATHWIRHGLVHNEQRYGEATTLSVHFRQIQRRWIRERREARAQNSDPNLIILDERLVGAMTASPLATIDTRDVDRPSPAEHRDRTEHWACLEHAIARVAVLAKARNMGMKKGMGYRLQDSLRRRLGWMQAEHESLDQVGGDHKISRERVRQIAYKASRLLHQIILRTQIPSYVSRVTVDTPRSAANRGFSVRDSQGSRPPRAR